MTATWQNALPSDSTTLYSRSGRMSGMQPFSGRILALRSRRCLASRLLSMMMYTVSAIMMMTIICHIFIQLPSNQTPNPRPAVCRLLFKCKGAFESSLHVALHSFRPYLQVIFITGAELFIFLLRVPLAFGNVCDNGLEHFFNRAFQIFGAAEK